MKSQQVDVGQPPSQGDRPLADGTPEAGLSVALKVHRHLLANHWREDGLVGPDPGIRLNYRVGRFVKSYLPFVPWRDDLYYLQAQGYWTLGNWELFDRTGDARYRDLAIACTRRVLAEQRADGPWDYPNPEWKGRVATVEGMWACEALLETYRREGDPALLDGTMKWHDYVMDVVGFQPFGDGAAINYFAHRRDGPVPNNSTGALRFFAKLASVTDDPSRLEPCKGLIAFLRAVQMPNGELPYQVAGEPGHRDRPHFQCPQYNAFQCLGIMEYLALTGDSGVRPMVAGLVEFLGGGLGHDGSAHYACGVPYRNVTYHAAALAAAFARAGQLGFEGYDELASRAYGYVTSCQAPDGGFPHSRRDYRVLSDRRNYPRYLAMIMLHMLVPGFSPAPAE